MNTNENAPVRGIQGADLGAEIQRKNTKFRKNSKGARVLRALMERSFNRFEAARELSDWCLHSTVAEIQSKGINVDRIWETVPGYQGNSTRCCRYWVPPTESEKARELLEVTQ